jgi:methoxymalonate biosynthesis protein
VSFSLPDVLVLAPDEMTDAAGWPRFGPPVVTDEARRRGELYAQRRVRQDEARAFGGSRDDFLRYCQTRLTITGARRSDVPRLHELSVRTHQFSSSGQEVGDAELGELLESGGHRVITARLSDRFGDDGIVGCCVIAAAAQGGAPVFEVWPLMMSCRAMGRGVIDALLAWICRAASDAGASQVRLPCVVNPRNVPLRIALVAAGFRVEAARAAGADAADGPALYVRGLDEVPELPGWVSA